MTFDVSTYVGGTVTSPTTDYSKTVTYPII